ncbi:Calpain-1 catalytic subunit, related [Eimeria praecox]|uniref:Calpain-1 catalytic subunit, related n=1 Tax=Eimeria praecox TaxID=51316 RepID=U6H689_9EIME|nr:Calpain-1 catalytic subunit, related [Eimeria praecox]
MEPQSTLPESSYPGSGNGDAREGATVQSPVLTREPQQQHHQLAQEHNSLPTCACKALLQSSEEGGLLEDPEFPRPQSGDSTQPPENGGQPADILKGLLWVRPDEIVQRIQRQQSKAQRASRPPPQQQQQEQPAQQQQAEKTAVLFSNNRIASTVAQGILPSHAFAAAASGLAASNPRVIKEALVHPQEWRFSHCHAFEEVWLPLLEKAYAKFLGSYEAVAQRAFRDIAVDLTGGIVEEREIQCFDAAVLWAKLRKAFNVGGCFLSCLARGADVEKDNILPDRHYTIVDVVRVEELRLLRLHNPWKVPTWRGEFSDYHRSWTQYPDLKDKLNYKFGDTPAAFWMKFETFLEVFTDICFCHSLPPQHKAPLLLQPLRSPRLTLAEAAVFTGQSYGRNDLTASNWDIQEATRCIQTPSKCETGLRPPAQGEVWSYAEGAEVYVTVQEETWKGLSLCGLPREWSRNPSAAAAVSRPAATPQQTPRSTLMPGNVTSSDGNAFCTSRRTFSGASCNTWGLQQIETTAGAAFQIGSKNAGSSAAAHAAPAAAAAASGPGAGSATTAAATPAAQQIRSSTVRSCTYTAVSRPSAFVRYERQAEGFDTAWVNAPMFLVSVPPPPSAAGGAACAAGSPVSAADDDDPKDPEQQQQQKERQQQQQQVDILLAITQDCSLDVAPISMAVFRTRVAAAPSTCELQ